MAVTGRALPSTAPSTGTAISMVHPVPDCLEHTPHKTDPVHRLDPQPNAASKAADEFASYGTVP